MKKLYESLQKNIFSKAHYTLKDIENDTPIENKFLNKIDKISETNNDLGHIYGSW
jgi:hypothetical protein